MHRHCFTYGSLMSADIMSRVCAAQLTGIPASLAGFSRHPVRGEAYPGIVPAARGRVDGLLYQDLPVAVWRRLDAFEGDLYERRSVSVTLADGRSMEADTYVFKPEHSHLLEPGDWDFTDFMQRGKADFEARYLGFDWLAQV